MSSPLPDKICVSCGRSFAWRRKWAKDWENVRYCSNQCRRERRQDRESDLESTMIELLSKRPTGTSICPSEVARASFAQDWRENMESVRRAARRLVARGRVDILQKGRIVDPDRARGPIRIKLR